MATLRAGMLTTVDRPTELDYNFPLIPSSPCNICSFILVEKYTWLSLKLCIFMLATYDDDDDDDDDEVHRVSKTPGDPCGCTRQHS